MAAMDKRIDVSTGSVWVFAKMGMKDCVCQNSKIMSKTSCQDEGESKVKVVKMVKTVEEGARQVVMSDASSHGSRR